MVKKISLLCAGAPQSGIVACIDAYCSDTGFKFYASFSTSPEIKAVMEGIDEKPDIVVAPKALMARFRNRKLVDADTCIPVGDVEVGVVVRTGVKKPNIDSPADVREAILKADCVLYNEATSGIYVHKMIKKLGIANQVKNKTERYPNAAALMERVGAGQGNEIGFGQIPAIRRFSGYGMVVVGTLPQELRNTTTYVAAITSLEASDDVKGFLEFLEMPTAQRILNTAGIVKVRLTSRVRRSPW